MERETVGSEWGGQQQPPRVAPKRKRVDLHDAGGLILLAVLVSPVVWLIVKWVLGM